MAESEFTPSEANNNGYVPAQVVYNPGSYGKLDPEVEGSWRWVLDGTEKVGFLWTDWQNAAGLVKNRTTEATDTLLRYLTSNKLMGAPASAAFSSAKFAKGITLSEQESGLLGQPFDQLDGSTTEENDDANAS